VRPPRLGGNKKMGVFATRATHRPNNLGLSAVKLDNLTTHDGRIILHVSGLDLIDGTPIVDIKPYIPYSDSIESAVYDFAQTAPAPIAVHFPDSLSAKLIDQAELKELITQVLSQDPKPAFHKIDNTRVYGANLNDQNVTWVYDLDGDDCIIKVKAIEPLS